MITKDHKKEYFTLHVTQPFKYDQQIMGKVSKVKKISELEKWIPDELGDDCDFKTSELKRWSVEEMFKVNEQTYGVHSTYKPNLEGYTVALKTDPNSEEFRDLEAKAWTMAIEIEMNKSCKSH